MSDLPSVHSQSPSPSSPSLPSVIPSPAPSPPPAPSLHPQRIIRQPRSVWMPEQWAVPQQYKQIREPTPPVPSSDEEDSENSDDPIDLINANSAPVTETTSYKQSQQRPEAQLWHTACEEEMEAHSLNGTWEIVKLPPGKHAIGSRWFMKVKCNADGSLDRYKARLVAKAILSALALISRRSFLPLCAMPPFAPYQPLQPLRTLSFALWTSPIHT